MTEKDYQSLYQYLGCNNPQVSDHFERKAGIPTGKFEGTEKCKVELFRTIFGVKTLRCEQYDIVAHGEGNEEEKIDSIYSSSLQSLLAFYAVDADHPLYLDFNGERIRFDHVFFEYKNKVIGYPSSVDVVLVGKREDGSYDVAFIESKYLEIVRDSTEKTKRTPAERKVIGVSYFDIDQESGYRKALGLSIGQLNSLGIALPTFNEEILKERPNLFDKDSGYLTNVKGLSKYEGSVGPLEGKRFVYAEGVKQILSHIIGIQNFKKNQRAYEKSKDPLGNIDGTEARVFYVELFNKFPGWDYASQKIEEFKEHAETVLNAISHKVDGSLVLTYQDLFEKMNPDFGLPLAVREYYRF